MTDIQTIENRLRAANPWPSTHIPTLSFHDASDIATAIMDSQPSPEAQPLSVDAQRPSRRVAKTTVRRALIAATVIATAAAGSLALTAGPSGPRAYATWNPTPMPVTGAAAQAAANQCRNFLHLGADLRLIVTERRGIYSYTVLSGPDSLWSCLVSPSQDGGLVGGGGGGSGFGHPLSQPSGSQVVVWGGGSGGAHDRDSYVSAIGRSGPDVTGIDARLPDGTQVQATVTDGWWTFWAPGTRQPRQITVHHADGTSTVQDLTYN